ncbi:MAG TPA: efflux RND transporter periplasmic adaptor subunit [Steroidobacteraceae bacterium]
MRGAGLCHDRVWRAGLAVAVAVAVALAAAAAAAAAAEPEESASVLVQTQMPEQGSMPRRIVAYGIATPSVSGSMTLSVQTEGRIEHIAVTAGEAVHAGQPLLEFALSPAARSNFEQAASALTLAREQRERTARLLAQQLATRDQLAQADKSVADAQAALAALEREHGGMPRQSVSAPFDGVVSAVLVAQGDRIAAGAPLLRLTRRGGLVITVGVEPSQRSGLRVGQSVDLIALEDGEPASQGTVSRIDHVLNPRTRLIDVDVTANAARPTPLLEGATYRAGIRTGELEGWVVPRDAVLSDDQGDYVFQVAAGKAVRVAVRRLGGDDHRSVIDGPLKAQRPLVTLGNYQLSDGEAVRLP